MPARLEAGPTLLVVALLVVPAYGIARTQPHLAKTVHELKQRDDVYILPPPEELRVMTLGYHAAAVDLLWAKLLVEYGTHWQEKRPFDARHYLDSIIAIEPTYAPVYKFADTILVYTPPRGYAADARSARAYLERGLKERPGDYEVWQGYGQFMAFLGPSFLDDQAERDEWRKLGANALLHSVELGADAQRSLAAATILRKYGQRDATIKQLTRLLAITDDEENRKEILFKLSQLEATPDLEEMHNFEARYRRDYPFLSRGTFTLVGPRIDAARCAGIDVAEDPRFVKDCARDWPELLEAQAAQGGVGR